MNPRVQQIFEQLCELPHEVREGQLAALNQSDEPHLNELRELFAAHDASAGFLGESTRGRESSERGRSDQSDRRDALAQTTDVGISEQPGSSVERYKLLEKIGEGGFGVVYMAQQNEPIRRRVALKIIKLGMDTRQVVARFEAERQALALMDHPNIARVIDGGSTESGRPFFVMELVRGDPITEYCDSKQLPMRQRLELFQQVCRAIEHAHQKGIIHRDIKPNNVLVTIADDKPLVKVIDFGIAKATSGNLTDKTLFTEFRQLLGTPLYMSPEQAERSGVDIDTRTDVYSLGVLLYEILTGRTPLDPKKLGSAAWIEFQRMIVEQEPSRPSAMIGSSLDVDLAEVAKRRSIEPSRLGHFLKGDLDWIVLKAIAKDRSRRYSTANHLATDIDRFLNDQPVEATPPSKVYQLRKFARRNRAILGTLTAVILALVVGLIATSSTAVWALRSERATQLALDRANRIATLAGGAQMLPESQARSLAQSWKIDIDAMAADKTINQSEIIEAEAQYTTWFAGWLSAHGFLPEANVLISHCYDNAKREMGVADPTFMNLCNLRVLVSREVGGDLVEISKTYDDLMESIAAVRGEGAVVEYLPQYAGVLARAKRFEDVAHVINQYAAVRIKHNGPLTSIENTRLENAIDQLMQSAPERPEFVQQLQAIRDTGAATDIAATQNNDDELANDLKLFQGKWKHVGWKNGKIVLENETEIRGDQATSRISANGMTHDRSVRVVLARSGGVKVFTSYAGGNINDGGTFIYHISRKQFILVTGMLQNHRSLDGIEMMRFDRITDEN